MGILIVALLATATVAHAGSTIPSRVTIRFDDSRKVERLEGKVYSPSAQCRRNRLVILFRVEGDTTMRVGEDRTNVRAYWFAEPEPGRTEVPPGTYYARIKLKKTGEGRCAANRSRSIEIP